MSAIHASWARLRGFLTIAVVVLAGASAGAAEWGELSGKLTYAGGEIKAAALKVDPATLKMCKPGGGDIVDDSLLVAADGSIANVVLYVTTKDVKVHPDLLKPPAEAPVIDNKECVFVPHIVPVMIKQPVVIKNSDTVAHNVNVQPLADPTASINPLLAPGTQMNHQFTRAQRIPVPVVCNIHSWMKGYVLPRDNPYFAVTAADGTFKIEKLPVGVPLEIQVWHEKVGYVNTPEWPKGKMTITLKEEKTDLGTVKLPVFPAK